MTDLTTWTGVEPLGEGETILLEASAGTGKTWQIEGLVVRLVAEYGVAIDRILVITFTNAATAELRGRVRQRLVEARSAVASHDAPTGDAIIEALWSDVEARGLRSTRLAAALASFDLAPISTIHGFSQRTLDQLAFESGQEPGLELLADPAPIVQRLVDDELALVYAEATVDELMVLDDMGWSRASLFKLAGSMCKAVAPEIEPKHTGDDSRPLGHVAEWMAAKGEFRAWLDSPAGLAAVEALEAELRAKSKRLDGRKLPSKTTGEYLGLLKGWLDGPASRSTRLKGPLATAVGKFTLDNLHLAWKEPAEELPNFGAYGLFERVSSLLAAQDRIWPKALAGFAHQARPHVEAELLRNGQLTYSSMLSRLAERIASQGGGGGQLATAIRQRYDVVLVDEFQDTDGAQWPVMQAAFAHPERRLLIIGDPKQAIYAFRGADVHVYLDAARAAGTRATMGTNWRSDEAYVRAMNHLWVEGSNAFDLADVDYIKVRAAPGLDAPRVRELPPQGERERRAFELRWVDGQTLGSENRVIGSKAVGADAVARLAALEAARLLGAETKLLIQRDGQDEAGWSPMRASDIAVLVRTNRQAERIRTHLSRVGIPSVSAGRGSVMQSPALRWICCWLDAVADPGRDRPARAVATTPMFGWSASDLAAALSAADDATEGDNRDPSNDDAADIHARWSDWLGSIRTWAVIWSKYGFVRAFERALDEFGVVKRLLGALDGERHATDVRHLVELCHAEERRTRLGPGGLASWLRAAQEAGGDGADDAQALRLESDARAVQIVTVHKSKGLEYPVVLLPFAWADFQLSDRGAAIEYHAAVGGKTELRLSLHPQNTPERQAAAASAALDQRREEARLLYVALTRARHHCVAWLGPIGKEGGDTNTFALGRTALRERDAAGIPVADGTSPVFDSKKSKKAEAMAKIVAGNEATWEVVRERLDSLQAISEGSVGWSAEPNLEVTTEVGPAASDGQEPLLARAWPKGRSLVTPWQVTSYTSMAAGRSFDDSEPQRLDEMRSAAASEREGAPEQDPSAESVGVLVELGEPVDAPGRLDTPIATHELRGGTEVGTWAHAVMENLDFQSCAGRDGRDLETLLSDLGTRYTIRSSDQQGIFGAALPAILDTPLDGGPATLPTSFSLRGIDAGDRVDELGFDLRLGAGNRWREGAGDLDARVSVEGARLALSSRAGGPSWGGEDWLDALLGRGAAKGAGQRTRGILPNIAGILTGFIDLTFRVEVQAEDGLAVHRYFVADYKTNRIASPQQRRDSHALHYTQPWMNWEMARHGYHLQALLYTVALHRFLRQRLPGYDYETHVGGHLYLFLRGMSGPTGPRDSGLSLGVYSDRWPSSVVLGLDAALSGMPVSEIREIIATCVDGARK